MAEFGVAGEGLERIMRDAEDGTAKAREMRERIGQVIGRGEAADGRITAEFTNAGGLSALSLDPRVLRLTSAELSREIMAAVNAATKDFQEQLIRVGGELFGGGAGGAGGRDAGERPRPEDAKPFQDPATALRHLEKMGDSFAGQMKDLLRELTVQQRRAREAAERFRDIGGPPG
ncbi:MAG TPA: YbaB/EbfC family nucleoid-associated protein [Streptosporangiaceae bacterium]